MAKKDPHIDYDLLAKYLAGECTDGELQQIESWLSENEENRAVFNQSRKLLADTRTADTFGKISFDTSRAWNKVHTRLDMTGVRSSDLAERKNRLLYVAMRVAAVLFITIGATYYFYTKQAGELIYETSYGQIGEYYLIDSTRVVLRENSSLRTDNKFNINDRQVRLTGIAYFDVTKNSEKPFIITTENAWISVLGTQFLVDESSPDAVSVTVESGKVKFASRKAPEKVSVILENNEKAELRIDDDKIIKSAVSNLNNLYWANNKLIYRQQSLDLVLDELGTIFNKTVVYDVAAVRNCKLTAVFRDENFDSILQHIAQSLDLKYEVRNGQYVIVSNGCTQE
jgi:transmembrane sensor